MGHLLRYRISHVVRKFPRGPAFDKARPAGTCPPVLFVTRTTTYCSDDRFPYPDPAFRWNAKPQPGGSPNARTGRGAEGGSCFSVRGSHQWNPGKAPRGPTTCSHRCLRAPAGPGHAHSGTLLSHWSGQAPRMATRRPSSPGSMIARQSRYASLSPPNGSGTSALSSPAQWRRVVTLGAEVG